MAKQDEIEKLKKAYEEALEAYYKADKALKYAKSIYDEAQEAYLNALNNKEG